LAKHAFPVVILINSIIWTRKGQVVRSIPWFLKNAVSNFMNYNLCETRMRNFPTQLKPSGEMFAILGRWKLRRTLRLASVPGSNFRSRESIHSIIFTNEGKSHERPKSEVRRHKSRFEVWTDGRLANIWC
jgi:hypothetical protein